MIAMETKNRISRNIQENLFLYILLLFMGSVAVRYVFSDFVKTLYVYRDELFYYSIANNMLTHRGITVYNAYSDFQKILYSFFLMPGFVAKDNVLRGHLFALINSVLMSSAIFPVYFLSRKIIKDRNTVLLLGFITILLPDNCYTMTFMSENAFLPFSLLMIYMVYTLFERENNNQLSVLLAVGVGIVSYLVYLCKSVGLVLLLAYVLYEFWNAFTARKDREQLIKIAVHFVIVLAVFYVLQKVVGSVLFPVTGTSEQIAGTSVLGEEGKLKYLFYSAMYFGVYIILGSGVVTSVFPLVRFNQLSKESRRLYVYTMVTAVVAAGVIAYMIYIGEDFLSVSPRAHLRYVTYIWMPFFIVYASLLETDDRHPSLIHYGILAALMLFVSFYFKGIVDVSGLDQMMLNYLDRFSSKMILIYRIVLPLLTVGLFWFFMKNRPLYRIVTLVFFSLLMLLNNALGAVYLAFCYKVPENTMIEFMNLQDMIRSNKDKNFLVVGEANLAVLDEVQRMADTFLNEKNVYTTDIYSLVEREDENGLNIAEEGILIFLSTHYYEDLDHADYLIVRKSFEIEIDPAGCARVDWIDNRYFDVYALNDPKVIPFIETPFRTEDNIYTARVDKESFKSDFVQDDIGFESLGEGYLLKGSKIPLNAGTYYLVLHFDAIPSEAVNQPGEISLGVVEEEIEKEGGEIEVIEKTILQSELSYGETAYTTGQFAIDSDGRQLSVHLKTPGKGIRISSIDIVRCD